MKIKIPQNELSKHISIVQKGISTKSTLPILDGILLRAKENKLFLTGTDLELGIESCIDCEVIEEGTIVITSKYFGDIVRKLPNSTVEIEVDTDNNVHIDCDNSNFTVIGQPSVDYPELPSINNDNSFNIPKDILKSMIKKIVFAIAQDETRPILTGALLEIKNNKASMVALDGYRLALKNIDVECKNDVEVVIPGKTLSEIVKILDDDDSAVKIKFTSNHILFHLGETLIISRLLEGQFLNYKDIIRNEYKSTVKVNTKLIKEGVERASLLSKEGKNNLVKFDITDEKLIITSNSDIGNVHEEVPIELNGNDIRIAFNSKYILDGLKAIDEDEIIMNFVSNVNPCIIKPDEDDKYIYLVLPVRLAEDN